MFIVFNDGKYDEIEKIRFNLDGTATVTTMDFELATIKVEDICKIVQQVGSSREQADICDYAI